jgi:protein-disulfide isomerase
MSTLIVPVNAGDHIQGSNDAQVTLVEYGDYQCPYCGEAFPIIKRIQKEMDGDLRFIFRNFPLTEIHSHALAAASAAEAAALHDRFWEMHDMLYENQAKLRDRDLIARAEKLKLNIERFMSDLSSHEVTTKIQEDFSGGIRSGVNGTPTFFINGLRHDGSYEYEYLLAALQEQLEPELGSGSRPRAKHREAHKRKMSHANPNR